MAFGESRIQIHDFTIFVESETRTVPMEIEPPVPIQPPTVPEVTQKVNNLKCSAEDLTLIGGSHIRVRHLVIG